MKTLFFGLLLVPALFIDQINYLLDASPFSPFADVKDRMKVVCDRTKNVEQRVFALLEAVFLPVSFLSLAALVVVAVLCGAGVEVAWFRGWWIGLILVMCIPQMLVLAALEFDATYADVLEGCTAMLTKI